MVDIQDLNKQISEVKGYLSVTSIADINLNFQQSITIAQLSLNKLSELASLLDKHSNTNFSDKVSYYLNSPMSISIVPAIASIADEMNAYIEKVLNSPMRADLKINSPFSNWNCG